MLSPAARWRAFLTGAIGTKRAGSRFQGWEEIDVPTKIKEPPPPKPDPKKAPVRPDKEASPEPQHVDPPPRDVREAPSPNPNGDKKS